MKEAPILNAVGSQQDRSPRQPQGAGEAIITRPLQNTRREHQNYMKNILRDIKTAMKLTSEIRKARKAGASVPQIRPVYKVPLVDHMPAWRNTIESGLTWELGRDTDRAVMGVFNGLPYEVQRRLEFPPDEPMAWAARARFWQQELRPVLPSKTYHAVMALFANWYAHCLRMRKEAQM